MNPLETKIVTSKKPLEGQYAVIWMDFDGKMFAETWKTEDGIDYVYLDRTTTGKEEDEWVRINYFFNYNTPVFYIQ